MKKILIACEFSGIVKNEFSKLGFNAWSCDLLPTEIPGNHIQDDVLKIINNGWDLMIAHPPCTHLAVSGAKHFYKKQAEQKAALEFVQHLINAPIKHIAIENPVSVISSKIRKPEQIIQPYMFGHLERKTTCLWLKNLPMLQETNNVKEAMLKLTKKEYCKVHYMAPSKERAKNRSRTFLGIAQAFAKQWGSFILNQQ